MEKRNVSHQAMHGNTLSGYTDNALADLSRIVDVTPHGQTSGVGQQAAFVPRTVAIAGASPYEGLDLDVSIAAAFPLALTHRTRRAQGPRLADTGQHSEQEWEQMKPVIHRIYLGEGKTLDDVMSTMSLVYRFQAR